MLSQTETIEIINAVERKLKPGEKLSFLSANETFNVYKGNKLLRVTLHEMLKIINLNVHLLSEERTQFDLIAEHILNKLSKNDKPFPDVRGLNEDEWAGAKLMKV